MYKHWSLPHVLIPKCHVELGMEYRTHRSLTFHHQKGSDSLSQLEEMNTLWSIFTEKDLFPIKLAGWQNRNNWPLAINSLPGKHKVWWLAQELITQKIGRQKLSDPRKIRIKYYEVYHEPLAICNFPVN